MRRYLPWGLLGVLLLGVICALGLKIYLATPLPAAQLSRLLTSRLQQPLRLSGLHTDGGTLYLTGVSLANPADGGPGNLMEADSIAIAPEWGKLLLGRRAFREIRLSGLRLDLRKNSAGVWNFSRLQRLLGGKKTPGEELSIGRLVVREGALLVNGQGARGIGLRLSNLSSRGSGSAGIELSFEDPARNRYSVSGKIDPGPDPAFELTLAAPAFSIAGLSALLKPEYESLLQGGRASLRVSAALHRGQLRLTGRLDFSQLLLRLDKRRFPMTGNLTFAAAYDGSTDQARLESLSLTTNDLIRIHAAGTVAGVRNGRRFAVTVAADQLELAGLALLLPEVERRKTVIGGKLAKSEFRLSGDAGGLTGAAGSLLLRGCSLERGGQLIFRGLDGSLNLSRQAAGFLAHGRLSLREPPGSALVEALDAPFDLRLSRRMKLLAAEAPSLTATVSGLGVVGRLGFQATAAAPFSLGLRITAANFSALEPLRKRAGIALTSGSGSLLLEATGKGPRDFNATMNSRLASLRGERGGRRFGVKSAAADSRLSMSNGLLAIAGNARLGGLSIGSGEGEGAFSYRYGKGTAVVEDLAIRFPGMSAAFARLSAQIEARKTVAGTIRYPLALELSGGEIKQGQAALSGLSGRLRGGYVSGGRDGWLEGEAELAAQRVAWKGQPVGSPSVKAAFSREGGRGTIGGTLLGGSLTGDVAFNTFAPADGLLFHLGTRGLALARIGELLPRKGAATPSAGTLDASAGGRFSRADGLACRFEIAGAGIAASGKGGKTLFSGGGARLTGEIAGQRILLGDVRLTIGEGVSLRAKGTVTNPFSPRREGSLAFSLPATSLDSMIDPLVNMLPRFIQEATVAGTVAIDGTVDLGDGRQLLEGTLKMGDVLLEVESQKFKTTGINGILPFSLDLSGGSAVKAGSGASFTRKNYPRLLEQLKAAPAGGQAITIGSTSFGSLTLGESKLRVSAGSGITKIVSLRSSLYEGSLLGSGFVAYGKGLQYRTDLLINGLSLKRFCETIPQIKDYISGRLDGVISLTGEGKDVTGLTGYGNLWVREGSGEKMLVSKTFLQKLAGKNLSGFFFRADRSFDQAEIIAVLEGGDLTFETLDISNTNLFGVRDLSVAVAPSQNRIALDHLLTAIKQAAVRGKASGAAGSPGTAPAEPEFKWQE